MTSKTMETKCKEYLRLSETIKELEEKKAELLKAIKAESGEKTTTWGKYYASFTESTSPKLKKNARQIAETMPDIFQLLGGYYQTTNKFNGIYEAK